MEDHPQVHPPGAADHSDRLDRVEGDLEAVEAAMRRLDEGAYGSCSVCGRDIAEDQLARDPLATACAEHAGASFSA